MSDKFIASCFREVLIHQFLFYLIILCRGFSSIQPLLTDLKCRGFGDACEGTKDAASLSFCILKP